MSMFDRLVAAGVAAVVLLPVTAIAAPAQTSAPTSAAAACGANDFPAGSVMTRAVATRGCRSHADRAVSANPESILITPGAIRPSTSTTITIRSLGTPPTPFVTGATVSSSGGAAFTNIVVATDGKTITATITTPSVEVFLTVTVTNNPGGFTYDGRIDVRNSTGEFHPVTPTRVFDTRFSNPTLSGPVGRLTANTTVVAPVAGVNGLPAGGIEAVAVNVTTVNPGADGFLTAWPSQTPKPDASSINYARGRTVANLVTVALGVNSGLALAASTDTDVILDVVGWYAAAPTTLPDSSPVASAYIPLTPERRTDTRFLMTNVVNISTFPVNGPLHASETRTLSLDSFGGELDAVDAVALNVTVSGPTAPSFLTIWSADRAQPNTSSVNFGTGDAIPNMVIVPISAAHQLNFFNSAGNTDVIVDLVGLYETPFFGGLIFESTTPTRIIDSRLGHGLPARRLNANETVTVSVGGVDPVPDGAAAVIMNAVVADSTTTTGFVTVYPADETQPNVSNLNVQIGRAAANQVMAPVSLDATSAIKIFNANGPADIIADVTGFFF